jgi:soluble lytic murein transglycosylase
VTKRRPVGLTLAFVGAGAVCASATLASPQKVPMPRARPPIHHSTAAAAVPTPAALVAAIAVPLPRKRPSPSTATVSFAQANAGLRGALLATRANFNPLVRPAAGPFALAPSGSASAADLAGLKQVIESTRKGKEADADAAERGIGDPVARKLAEWVILRSDNTTPSFERYASFVAANPSWPHAPLFRRRAENALWNDKVDDATVKAFFATHKPTTAKGRFVLARVLMAQGDREGAAALVRYAWRYEDCSIEVEKKVIETFGGLLTRTDHKIRMEQRFYADDVESGLRAGERLGGNDLLIARARAAVIRRAGNAKAALDAVPVSARSDPGYIFSRAQWLRKNDQSDEAARLILSARPDADSGIDPDQWWVERRLVVRKLLDDGDAHTAYRVARDAVPPMKANYRVDQLFTVGWVALRFLHDPATAASYFAQISHGTDNPYALARGGYWEGRAAEAMGQRAQAKAFYEEAARHSATYYGQLARARLGLTDLGLRGPPVFTAQERHMLDNLEIVRAAEMLYALDERDMLASMYAELGESGTDVAGMAMLAEVAAKHDDGRSMLLLGKGALGRGLPLDYYAYPVMGLPRYQPIAPPIEAAVAYSIARQESHFNQKVVSIAKAMGLMQVTPEAAQDTAKRFKATYNKGRLLSDPVYNMQMGAAELSMLLTTYNGSYPLTFAGYNAGRGRVKQWIAAYGDPRDPSVDPVDWVERIPISETRNYVQRIMENLQVYRARFGGSHSVTIEADLKRGGAN